MNHRFIWGTAPAFGLALVFAGSPAIAGDADWSDAQCQEFCHALDAVEEGCEDLYGDGDEVCEAIGAVEEQCDDGSEDVAEAASGAEDDGAGDDESGAADPTCAGICGAVDDLEDLCEDALGEEHSVCLGLEALADGQCEEEDDDAGEDEDDGVECEQEGEPEGENEGCGDGAVTGDSKAGEGEQALSAEAGDGAAAVGCGTTHGSSRASLGLALLGLALARKRRGTTHRLGGRRT